MGPATLDVTSNPATSDVERLVEGLREYNEGYTTVEHNDLGIFARDEHGLMGGLYGYSRWGWLYVRYLWVRRDCRHAGLGRHMLLAAEAEARKRRCVGVHLDTFDFQALDFYRKLGYTVHGCIENYPGNYARYYLKKRLDAAAESGSL